ncbi:5236_t:CDS:1, partial [Dentiscutata heterogama]
DYVEQAETTTQEKVEIDDSVEVNMVNTNQQIAISTSVSTQVSENIDPYIMKESTNPISTGQNGQDKNDESYHQRPSTEQQQGLSTSNPNTPTT